MIHRHAGKKLGLVPNQRKAILRQLSLALLEHESIRTTRARAEALSWYADRLVTWGKAGDVASRRLIHRLLGSTASPNPGNNRVRQAVENLYTSVVPRFKDRQGGYTQTILLADRRPGDNAEMCVFRYLPGPESKTEKRPPKNPNDKSQKQAKKAAALEKAPSAEKKEAKAKGPQDKPAKAKKKDK